MFRFEYDMLDAIASGNKEKLEGLIAKLPSNFNPNFLDIRNKTSGEKCYSGLGFLHCLMVTSANINILDMLLKIPGIDVNLRSKHYDMTPLYLAITQIETIGEDKVCTLVTKLMSVPTLNLNTIPIITNYGFNSENLHYTPFEHAATKLSLNLTELILNGKGFSLANTNLPNVLNEILLDADLYTDEDNSVARNTIVAFLIQLGAGIGCSFTESLSIEVNTENCIFIGTIVNGTKPIKINRSTPGFEKAITTPEECEKALLTGALDKHLNFLIQSCHSALNKADTLYREEIAEIASLLTEYKLRLKNICLKFIALSTHPSVCKIDGLPEDLQIEVVRKKIAFNF